MKKNHDYLSSVTNPNGLLEELSGGHLESLDARGRLVLAVADTMSFLVEVAGLDPDLAEVAACRSTREVLGALGVQVSERTMGEILTAGSQLSEEVAVDRAIDMTLNNE